MSLSKILRSSFLIITACLVLTACATKKVSTVGNQIQGDVYIGSDTVEYLASGVPDRVFFATNESILTTRSRDTLRKQACLLYTSPCICPPASVVVFFVAQADNTKHAAITKNVFLKILLKVISAP